jgi:hypothetical protein
MMTKRSRNPAPIILLQFCRREKEMLKALQQQERNAMRLRARGAGDAGPKDDVDFEWEALIAEYRAQHG